MTDPQPHNPNDVHRVLSGHTRSPRARLLRTAAALAEPFYTSVMHLRNFAFDRRLRPIHRAHCPVISIGNLTTGGTGKTPMVIHTVQSLLALNRHPAVILRGYRADATGQSDEAQLLADQLHIPIITNPDRVAAAKQLHTEHPDVDTIVLDDAFQHRRIARDLDIVLIDATNPFGYDHVLPRGLMREHPRALRRAHAIIVTRADLVTPAALQQLDARIAHHHGRPPLAHCTHHWQAIVDQTDTPIDSPTDTPVFVLTGIGNPAAFVQQANTRFRVVAQHHLPDHHDYTPDQLTELAAQAQQHNAQAILTTEKDWVKLRDRLKSTTANTGPIWRPRLGIQFLDGTQAFQSILTTSVNT